MKRRVIIWTAMGVALAVAPLAAEARNGRNGGTRRMVLGCGENACVASTATPTTATLLSDLTGDTTAAPTTAVDTTAVDATTGSTEAEPTTVPTSESSDASAPTTPSAPSIPSGTDATSASTTTAATAPEPTTAGETTTAATTADTSTATEATLPATEPSVAPTEPSVAPTPATTEPPTPPTTVGTPPLGGSFLMSTSSPKVGVPVTFDVGDLTCDPVAACSYTWQWSFRSASGSILTGGQIGRGETVTYTFDDFAAAKPFVFVTLTVSEGRVGFHRTYTSTFTVTP